MTNVPYPQPGQPAPYAMQPEPKSKVTAALLAFFLGDLGVHNFYLGQKGRGIGHLALFLAGMIILMVSFAGVASSYDPSTGVMSEGAAAGAGIGLIFAYLLLIANGIWRFVEFIMILVKNDGSLR